jgi:cardiolipin synthase
MAAFNKKAIGSTYLPNKVKLVNGGKDYFSALTNLINNAATSIHLQTYIFADDDTGRTVAKHLADAAERGVKVFLLADGYASQRMSRDTIIMMKNAGAYFRLFEPIFKSTKFYVGRRLHHKIAVADGRYALVGGVNIADRYNDFPDIPAWKDVAVLIEGPAAYELEGICCEMWNAGLVATKAKPGTLPDLDLKQNKDEYICQLRVRRNDWVKNKNQIARSYSQIFKEVNKDLTIMCSYFLPGRRLRSQMKKAARRGVDIKVIVSGLSDVPMAKPAERYFYGEMLKNKIKLYEYHKNILHAKVAVADGNQMTIGSYNLNNISAYASIELNVDIISESFVSMVREKFENIITNECTEITPNFYASNINVVKLFTYWLSFQLIRVTIFLFTFYFRREEQH